MTITKILQIPNYQYPHIGGIEQTSRDISNILANNTGIEQKIICFNEDAKDGKYICHRKETVHDNIEGVEVIRCGCFAKVASQSLSFTYYRELKRVINSFNPDYVIFHYPNPFVASLLLSLLPDETKLILYWHLDIVKQKILGTLFHGQNKKLCKRAWKIIATSPNYIEGSKYLSENKEKCIVIPSCIRPERFIENSYTVSRIEEIKNEYKGKTICYAIGRHVPYKGIGKLVEASKYLDSSFVILIGGKGELTEKLKENAKDDEKIVFVGTVKEEDMVAYYKACDIFCFPSITKNEAFGLTLAEAMYFGKPAVTFTIPGSGVNYVNLNGITGIECPNQDAEAFAAAIKKLNDDRNLMQKYGQAAKDRVVNNFLYEQFEPKINALLK